MSSNFFNIIPGNGTVAILLYGEVGNGQPVDSGRVVSELLALQSQYDKIDVRINSNGGDVFSGIAIYNALRTSTADINIYVDGVAASIAAIIALCGKPLYMSPYAKLMLHSVSGGTCGNASDLRRMTTVMEELERNLAGMIAARCGMSAEDVSAKFFDEVDHWISAQEAVEMKLADGVYDMQDNGEPAPKTHEEIYQYFNNRLTRQPKNYQNMALIDQLKSIPSFSNINDEAAIVNKVRELANKATKVDALETANAEYKQQLQLSEAKEQEAIIDKAISDGRITAEQKAHYVKLMAADRVTTEELLNSIKQTPKPRAASYINPDGTGSYSFTNKTWDELDKAGRLGDLKSQNKDLFAAKFKEKFGVDYRELEIQYKFKR